MKGCYNCAHGAWLNGEDDLPEICVECNYAPGYPSKWEEKRITNADRIRAMSDEELASWALYAAQTIGMRYSNSLLGLVDWLKQPAEGD